MANRAKFHNTKNKYKMLQLNRAADIERLDRRRACEAAKAEAKRKEA